MNILIRQHFGLAAEPWKGFHLATADLDPIGALARAAAVDQSMVQIVGPRGSGKTHAVLHDAREHARPVQERQRLAPPVVRPQRADRRGHVVRQRFRADFAAGDRYAPARFRCPPRPAHDVGQPQIALQIEP